MIQSERPAAISVMAVIVIAFAALVACRERDRLGGSIPPGASVGELVDTCADDSLRPAAAAPAHGLWLYEQPSSSERGTTKHVAAMIGPPRSDERALVVTRPVESLEVSASGDTLRHRVDAATVSLELLPTAAGPDTLGGRGVADSTVSAQPAATYSVSPRVRLAAYEPCATSSRGPRIRYLRLDAAGRIVTDVMLRRASER